MFIRCIVFMKTSYLSAWTLLAFMDRFYVFLKVSFLRKYGSTMCTWKFVAFMYCFYVFL